MNISNKGIELIKKYEGCKLTAYKCPAGVWTIGFGHTGNVHKGLTITQETANEYLKKDLEKFVNHVNTYNTVYNFNQNEFDALISFAFNIGNINGLTKNGKRSKKEIAEKILLYNKAGGRVLDGLNKRRKEEREMFLNVQNVSRETLKTVDEIVNEVLNGNWGNGNARKSALIKAGYDYKEIQKKVNEIKKGG